MRQGAARQQAHRRRRNHAAHRQAHRRQNIHLVPPFTGSSGHHHSGSALPQRRDRIIPDIADIKSMLFFLPAPPRRARNRPGQAARGGAAAWPD
ncbi:hypothetical protein SL003B_4094 [Polymorphum gilvum SL003B-26A1]|uniref:Uncharacterized protein n=1 Tax=Polymorphum gilvum (strain LMG 25793 / CGMCC 1.9160 / SL003B-26A1) TaxID=991905 RepID=F2J6M8_POLGS|nr:hypothetical protein SL003B_4094 [Polymorphum gilvum SL003B-26A1]